MYKGFVLFLLWLVIIPFLFGQKHIQKTIGKGNQKAFPKSSGHHTTLSANVSDSLVLIDLYSNTNGTKWSNQSNWLSTSPLSTWYGVRVNANGNVDSLGLGSNNLQGIIPNTISSLTKLLVLDLSNNNLSGNIPDIIGNLTALQNLDLSQNLLTDTIPSSMGNLSNLNYLNLSFNPSLTGAIPSTFGNLTKLNNLTLNQDSLTSSIPNCWANLTKLINLNLRNNHFTGNIPSSIGNLTSLDVLYLDNNQLSGPIPTSFSNLNSLEIVYLNDNNLSGNIPTAFAGISGLEDLYLQNNYFNFQGLEYIGGITTFFDVNYTPQFDTLSLNIKNGNKLSVSAGGTLANNTYQWYWNNLLIANIVGDSTFTAPYNGLYSVSINNSKATLLTLNSDTVSVNIPPNVVSFNPQTLTLGGTLTIKGYGFTGATIVNMGGVNALSFQVLDDSTITAQVGANSSGNVKVVTPYGSSNISGFVYCPGVLPNLSIVANTLSIQPKTWVTFSAYPVNGGPAPALQWLKNGKRVGNGQSLYLDSTLNNGDSIGCLLTSNFACATSNTVKSNVLAIKSNTNELHLYAFSPHIAGRGTKIMIKGAGFKTPNILSSVLFGGVEADSFRVFSDSMAIAYVGNGNSGAVAISNGINSDSAVGFSYCPLGNYPTSSYPIGIIQDFAGSGIPSNSGDGGLSIKASFNAPTGVMIDKVGNNLYITDRGNNRLRSVAIQNGGGQFRVKSGGTVSPKGGAMGGSVASLLSPYSSTMDNQGHIFIANTNGNQIVGIDSLGRYYLVAGNINGISGFSDGVDTLSLFNGPTGIVSDGGHFLYVSDQLNNRIRKIDLLAHTVTTIAGNGSTGFSGEDMVATQTSLWFPTSLVLDNYGALYIADSYNNRIRMLDSFGFLHTVAGNGMQGYGEGSALGLSCSLNKPSGVAFSPDGTLFIADSYNNRIRILKNGQVYTIAGLDNDTIPGYVGDSIPSNQARMNHPVGLSVDTFGGFLTLFIADVQNNRIREVSLLPLSSPKNSIEGHIATALGNPVSGVNILANGILLAASDSSGLYHIQIDSGSLYTIVPTQRYDSVKTSGVDVIDILQETNHILGKNSCLTTPYSLLAGDVNGDSTIDVLDVLIMKRLILGIDTAFQYPTKGSVLWVFVDSNYVFPDSSSPWGRHDTIFIKSTMGILRNKSFMAIKLGDVDGSWSPLNNVKPNNLPTEKSETKKGSGMIVKKE